MSKNDNTLIGFGLIALVLFVTLSGTGNIEVPLNIDTPTPNLHCDVSFSKTTITAGEDTTFVIDDGELTECNIYYRVNNGAWSVLTNAFGIPVKVTTGLDGKVEYTGTLTTSGTYDVAVVCGECVSNSARLIVEDPAPISDCSETDGGDKPFVGGKTTTRLGTLYDTCQNSNNLLEFYCSSGFRQSKTYSCSAGCVSGGNGDYCATPIQPSCSDTDGGNDIMTYGVCTDNSGSTADVCPLGNGNVMISEAYCSDGVCSGISTACPPEHVCINGQCVIDQWPCESIINPQSQFDCDGGYCSTAGFTCMFEEADLVNPARCRCLPIP